MNGIFYSATGDRCRYEAVKSARSVKKLMPDVHVTLYTDLPFNSPDFDRVLVLPDPAFSYRDKIPAFLANDYEKAIFLDSDTYVVGDIRDLFDLLDTHDIAATIEVARGYWYHDLPIPESFPELNSGVVAFRKSLNTQRLFHEWLRLYDSCSDWQRQYPTIKDHPWDQPSLRQALYAARDIRLCTLPTEYNALRHFGTFLWGPAKIVHGRGNIEEVAERMNRFTHVERVYLQQLGMVSVLDRVSTRQVLETCVRVNACVIKDLARRAWNYFRGIFHRSATPPASSSRASIKNPDTAPAYLSVHGQ